MKKNSPSCFSNLYSDVSNGFSILSSSINVNVVFDDKTLSEDPLYFKKIEY